MSDFWAFIQSWLEQDVPVFVALVVANSKHSPGTRGARLCLSASGHPLGTVGGGGMERDILARGRRLLAEGRATAPFWETLVHRKKPGHGQPSGMICAGEQVNLYAVLTRDDLDAISDAADAVANDKPGVLSFAASGVSFERDSRPAAGFEPGDDWRAELQVLCGRRAAIMGGGHCGLALSRVLEQLGYVVSVFDTRPNVHTLAENVYARYIEVVEDYADAAASIRYPQYTEVAIMTADYPSDVRALVGLGESPASFPYVGVMGAPAKLRAIVKDLRAEGISEEFIDSLVAPIGLEMKSDTPEEIAISVAAQLLRRASRDSVAEA